MNDRILTLVPPESGGVLDFATIVNQGVRGRMLKLTPQTGRDALACETLILHFSGYGYQARGVPLWLLQRIREARPRVRRLGIFFHELYASGPPWRSAFWLSGTQKRIAAELASMADFWVTNREDSARWLRARSADKPHRVLPVFSNVGEPEATNSVRARKIVVFGTAAVRSSTYLAAGPAFLESAAKNGFEVHDIGPRLSHAALNAELARHSAVVHGSLSVPDVSRHLSTASHGLLAYPSEQLTKSGVFAAYCAHQLCPVLLSKTHGTQSGLQPGKHFLAGWEPLFAQEAAAAGVGHAARAWYEPHRISVHVEALEALCDDKVPA